jgi:phosphoglycerate kinase
MNNYKTLHDISCAQQRVIVREDFNVPMNKAAISSDARLRAALPTLKFLLAQKASVLIFSHLGRPKEGLVDPTLSLAPVAKHLSQLLQMDVKFFDHWQTATLAPGEIGLAENIRFEIGEKANDPILAQAMAAHCDIFVMDAFACAHRAEASTVGIAQFASVACAGLLLEQEVLALERAFANPQRPLVAIIGGSKVSTKLHVLRQLLTRVDHLIVGGGIANTFLHAQGFIIGRSLYEPDFCNEANALIQLAKETGKQIPLPIDVVVATKFERDAPAQIKFITELDANDMILDIGPKTCEQYRALLLQAGTIVWNGPVGVFEFPLFANGTQAMAKAVAESQAFSLAGGGDTISALEHFGFLEAMSYVSTGGGAFIEFMEGKILPALAILAKRAQTN